MQTTCEPHEQRHLHEDQLSSPDAGVSSSDRRIIHCPHPPLLVFSPPQTQSPNGTTTFTNIVVMKRRKPVGESRTPAGSQSQDREKNKKQKRDAGPAVAAPSNSPALGLGINPVIVTVSLSVLSIVFRLYYSSSFGPDGVNVPLSAPLPLSYPAGKWGSLRPGVYFGMKSMSPESLVAGMMWFRNRVENGNSLPIRHWCHQDDRLMSYSWLKHDFDSFGVQQLVDNDLIIRTDFLVEEESKWSARISIKRNTSSMDNIPVSLILYTGTENRMDRLFVEETTYPFPASKEFKIAGQTTGLPDGFSLSMKIEGKTGNNVLFRSYMGDRVTPPLVHLKESLMQHLSLVKSKSGENLIVLRDATDMPLDSNFLAHQILFTDEIMVRMDFQPNDAPPIQDYESKLKAKEEKFSADFESLFQLKKKGFSDEDVKIAEAIAANMIGGIGFFSGYAKVASDRTQQPVLYGPHDLLTAVPSRSFFPRGFLWDEGFHHLLISRMRPDISVNVLKSWLSLMNVEGWIPREVILGYEAEARVPDEFVVQRNTNANPPTLFLTIESMMDRKTIPTKDLEQMFPRIQVWYKWLMDSQSGPKDGTFRWRGRNASDVHELNPKTLTSGLDDYPRASHPTDDEYHIDLRSWMTLASRVMARVARAVGQDDSIYEGTTKVLSDNKLLDDLHWSEEDGMYCDYGMDSQDVKLVPKVVDKKSGKKEMIRKATDSPVFRCVHEFGYVSLFPMLLQILEPSNERLGLTMTRLDKELLTPFGLRSLSQNSRYYDKRNKEQDLPYWRSAVWLNVNFLALRSLRHYSGVDGPFKEQADDLYTRLRDNIIETVLKSYRESGYIWEQYSDKTGKGQGSHPFTGWSALVLLIMSEDF